MPHPPGQLAGVVVEVLEDLEGSQQIEVGVGHVLDGRDHASRRRHPAGRRCARPVVGLYADVLAESVQTGGNGARPGTDLEDLGRRCPLIEPSLDHIPSQPGGGGQRRKTHAAANPSARTNG